MRDRVAARPSRETRQAANHSTAAMTAARRTLQFGVEVTVINHDNGRSAVVRTNDRSPFVQAE
jgi:rare lipoprotein A